MVHKIQTFLIDDLDPELEASGTVEFARDGAARKFSGKRTPCTSRAARRPATATAAAGDSMRTQRFMAHL